MKYWRGYLIAAIIAAITIVINRLGSTYSKLVDMVYPYLTRTVQTFLAKWSGGLDFCVWQVAAVVLVLLALVTIVLMIVLRWNPIQWLGWILAGAACIWLLQTGIYGLNYHAGPISDDIRLNVTEYTLDELENATIYYRDRANELADMMNRDGNGDVIFPEFEVMALDAANGFKSLVMDRSYSIFAGSTQPVKKLGWSKMYTSMGITGYTMGITGEAAVNPDIPAVSIPFTMCHEMAHRMCIAIERDANFGAFLACDANSSKEFQYSGYFMAYLYCYEALYAEGSAEATTIAARIDSGVKANLRNDLDDYNRFFHENMDEKATRTANKINDRYLKTSGDEAGIASYAQVSDLLVSWHIQDVVLPSLQEDEVSTFDPYDESQVDLSGIVNAKVDESTEDTETTEESD